MSNVQNFHVEKVYPTNQDKLVNGKKPKYQAIVHMSLSVELPPVVNADGEVIDQETAKMYFRKGFNSLVVKEGDEIPLDLDNYSVKTVETTWLDKDTQEERTGTENWITPTVKM